MDLQITGKVIEVLEEKSGESANGPWRKQDFILETEGQYPRQVCITQWGDNIDKFDVQEGETLTAHIDIQSREYKGRWYTDVKAWRIERVEQLQPEPDDQTPRPPFGDSGDGADDDLPF